MQKLALIMRGNEDIYKGIVIKNQYKLIVAIL